MAEESILNEAVQDTAEETTQAVENPESQIWMYADEVQGSGEAPEWFKSSKYKTVADQAKAYAGLESKLGSFTGAPEDGYDLTGVSEELGVEFEEGDALLDNFNNWAKEAGLSQEAHTELLKMYVSQTDVQEEQDLEAEMKKIGDNAQERIKDMVQWARGNLSKEEFATLENLTTTAEGFHLIEKLRGMTRETQISKADNAKPVDTVTESKLYELIADPRYESSPSFRAEVEAKFKEFYGTAPQNEIRA